MRSYTLSVLTVYLAAATSAATAQTVTVGKSGTVDYGTIQAAIDSFATNDNPEEPNVVQITDNAVYDEVINISVPLTLIGTGTERPVLAVQSNPLGYDDDGYNNGNSSNLPQRWTGDAGLLINLPDTLSTASVALHNLIIIPSQQGTPPIAGIVNKANNFFLDMENLLVTSNDGSDQPVNTDGMSDAGAVATSFRVSGAHIGSHTNNRPEGDGVEVHMRDCIFTNIKGDLGTSWRTGFYMYRTYNTFSITNEPIRPGAFRRLVIDGKCIFSYNVGSGLRCSASLEIHTPEDRTLFIGNTADNLWLDMQAGADTDNDNRGDNLALLNGIISYSAGLIGINEGTGTSGPRMNLKNSIIANSGWYGTYHRLGSASVQDPSLFENVTIANNALVRNDLDQIQSSLPGSTIDLETTNTIIAGNGLVEHPKNRVYWEANGVLTFTNTALVTEGPFALNPDAPIVTNPNAVINGTFVTNEDPEFVNTTDPTSPDYYAVANSAYGNLAYEGGPLTGGGSYAGASVNNWTLY